MRILILGASGLVGSRLMTELMHEGYDCYGTYCSREIQNNRYYHFDLSNVIDLTNILNQIKPDIIISSLRGDFEIQFEAHKLMIEYCKKNEASRIFFISTINVFDADLTKTHSEYDETNSDSEYGIYKAKCEKLLQNELKERTVIFRIPMVWDVECPRRKQIEACINNGEKLKMWDPLIMGCTTPYHIANWIKYIIDNPMEGIFHITSVDMLSMLDFYREYVSRIGICEPEYDIEHLENKCWQAIEIKRTDIPNELLFTMDDVLNEC